MTTNHPDNFQNENITVTLKREPGCRVHLDVVVTPKAVQASRHQALKTINKEVSLPGFRKGKAPEALILQNFGKNIEQEWKEILLNTSFDEAINLIKIFPFTKQSLQGANIKSISAEKGAILSFDYEESPRIPQISFEELSIPVIKRHPVTEKDVAEAIENIRLQQAEWIDITDRPIQENDYVDLDIDILSEPAHNACTDARFGVSPGKMDIWMRKLLIGKNSGETVEGMSEKPDHLQECNDETHDHHHDHENFVPAHCRITVHAIKQPKLAELTEEFAKKLGATSVEDLKEKVNINLNRRADEEQKNTQRSLMEQSLLNKFPFDIPHSFVQGHLKDQKKGIIDSLRASDISEASIPEELKKIEHDIALKVDHDMRLFFITQRVARDHHIEVPEDEVMMEWMRLMWMQKSGQNAGQLPADPEEAKSQLHLKLLIIKALDFLVDKAAKQA